MNAPATPPRPSLWRRLWAALLGRSSVSPRSLPAPPAQVDPVGVAQQRADAMHAQRATDLVDAEEIDADEVTAAHDPLTTPPPTPTDPGRSDASGSLDHDYFEDDEAPSQAEAAWLAEDAPTFAPTTSRSPAPVSASLGPATMPRTAPTPQGTTRTVSMSEAGRPDAAHDPFQDLFDALEDTTVLSPTPRPVPEPEMQPVMAPVVTDIPPPTPTDASSIHELIDQLAVWQDQVAAQRAARAEALAAEAADLEERIRQLAMNLEQVRRAARELEQAPDVRPEAAQRAREGIVAHLGRQAEALHGRALQALAAEEARQAAMTQRLAEDPEMSATWVAWSTFDPAALPDTLPDSYRQALLGHHGEQGERIRAWLDAHDTGSARVEGPALALDVVVAVDGPPGLPALVSVVVPVSEQVSLDWEDRGDDLQLQVAARAVQALCELAVLHDVATTQVAYGGHDGLLALELELPTSTDGLAQRVLDGLHARFAAAPELDDASVTVRALAVSSDHLLPPTAEE